MVIELKAIKIKDLVKGFKDDEEAGVVGYDGMLDIRPAYQRNSAITPCNRKRL